MAEPFSVINGGLNQNASSSPLRSRDAGGTSGGMSDDWKISVESRLTELHADVRNLLYGLIGGFLLLAAGGWVVYDKLADAANSTRVEQAKSFGESQTKSAETAGKIDLLLERTAKK